MKNSKLLFCLFLTASFSGFCQHYSLLSNYINNTLVINPAFAGKNELLDITLLHRSQWTGMNGSPTSNFFTINSPLKIKSANVGFSILDDRIGATQTQNLNGIFAYRFQTGNMKCSFGMQAGIDVLRAAWDKLKRNDAADDLIIGQQQTTIGFVTGAGYYMYNKLFSFGLSMPYVVNTNSKKSIAGSPLIITSSYMFVLGDSSCSAIKPSLLIRYVDGSPVSYDASIGYFYKKKYGLSLSYRAKESLVAILEIPIQQQFIIYYSYDMGIGKLNNSHNGSHELMIRYLFKKSNAETPVNAEPVIEK